VGQKTVRFSDLSGELITRDDALARIVIHEHPELGDSPVEIEALADEAAGLAPGRVRRAGGADHAAGLSQKSGGGAVRRTRPFCIPCQGLTN